MPYTINVQCRTCGHKWSYRSDEAPLLGSCPLCWREPKRTNTDRAMERGCPGVYAPPDLTAAEALLEDQGKDDS